MNTWKHSLPFITRTVRIGVASHTLFSVRFYGITQFPFPNCVLLFFFIRNIKFLLPKPVMQVPLRLSPVIHSLLYVPLMKVADCFEVHSILRKTATCTHLFPRISSITVTFVEVLVVGFTFFPNRRAERASSASLMEFAESRSLLQTAFIY